MRMPPHQLLIDRIQRVFDAEQLLFRGHLRKEDGLQHEVAQFFAQPFPIPRVDRVQHFISLFERVGLDGVEGLLTVPGATAGGAEHRHDLH